MTGWNPGRLLVGLLATLAGCTSAPVRHYTLTPPPGNGLPAPGKNLPIEVRVTHIPAQVDRSELLVRTGTSEMTILENERWASPVKDEIKDALRLVLERHLGRLSDSRPAFSKLTLDVDVQHFEAELGRYALFEATWSASLAADPGSNTVRFVGCTFRAQEKIPTGYTGIVEGYQHEIAGLGEAIATKLTGPASSDGASCQALENSGNGSGSSIH